jgi:hypothetical protein
METAGVAVARALSGLIWAELRFHAARERQEIHAVGDLKGMQERWIQAYGAAVERLAREAATVAVREAMMSQPMQRWPNE